MDDAGNIECPAVSESDVDDEVHSTYLSSANVTDTIGTTMAERYIVIPTHCILH